MPEMPAEERVALVEVHLRRVGAPDVGAEQLRHACDLRLRARRGHAVADDDDGSLGAAEQPGRLRRAPPRGYRRLRHDGRRDGLVIRRIEHVGRQRHEDRAHRWRGRDLDGATEDAQERPGIDHARGPLRHRPRDAHQVRRHLGVHGVVAETGLSRDDDERAAAALRLVEHADPVPEADAAVQLDHRRAGALLAHSRPPWPRRWSPGGSGCSASPGSCRAHRGSPAPRCRDCRTCG